MLLSMNMSPFFAVENYTDKTQYISLPREYVDMENGERYNDPEVFLNKFGIKVYKKIL